MSTGGNHSFSTLIYKYRYFCSHWIYLTVQCKSTDKSDTNACNIHVRNIQAVHRRIPKNLWPMQLATLSGTVHCRGRKPPIIDATVRRVFNDLAKLDSLTSFAIQICLTSRAEVRSAQTRFVIWNMQLDSRMFTLAAPTATPTLPRVVADATTTPISEVVHRHRWCHCHCR